MPKLLPILASLATALLTIVGTTIAIDARYAKSAEELAPHDRVISLQIPGASWLPEQAEAARAAIRERYSIMQTAIDAAKTIDAIHAALN